jgi:hypothetical protein
MTGDEADKKMRKCVDYIQKQFGQGETAFGLVVVVRTDEDPEGDLGYSGSMTLRETGDVIQAYLEGEGPADERGDFKPILLN